MQKTKTTGQICVGDLRLLSVDVGFNLKLQEMAVEIPDDFSSVGIEQDGETYLVEGTREEMIQAIRDAGYKIAE